jgi:type IV pilus assembly protein PilV
MIQTKNTFFPENEKGFTLIEVLLSISILAIGLLGMPALQATATKGNALAKKNTLAISLAEDKIEEYKNTLYDNIIPTDGTTEENLHACAIYKRISKVEDNTPITGVKSITVTVTWQNGSKSVSFTTLISQNGA